MMLRHTFSKVLYVVPLDTFEEEDTFENVCHSTEAEDTREMGVRGNVVVRRKFLRRRMLSRMCASAQRRKRRGK
jgi:hypothetical protein